MEGLSRGKVGLSFKTQFASSLSDVCAGKLKWVPGLLLLETRKMDISYGLVGVPGPRGPI